MKFSEEHEKDRELFNNGFLYDSQNKTIYSNSLERSVPPKYQDWSIEKYVPGDYLKQRLVELCAKDADNEILLTGGVNTGKDELNKMKIFTSNKFGDIEILQYSLHRKPYTYTTKGAETNSTSNREKYNVQVRLHPFHENMKEGKYDFSEARNVPFWPPQLVDKFDDREQIKQLVITEGQIKAFKSALEGVSTVGLTSISHYKNRDTETIHPEIVEFIRTCEVEKLVILWDGDCRNISSKALQEENDLSIRPGNFYKFAKNIRELIQDFFPPRRLQIFFATIKSDQLNEQPKGMDDLLITHSESLKDIKTDLDRIGDSPSKFFEWINISNETGVKKMRKFFKLDSVRSFYQYHQEQIKDRDFIFYGTTYRVENNEPLKKIDANVKNFKRIGTDYYKISEEPVPSVNGNEVSKEEVLLPWTKSAIIDDHGKEVIKHIERFDGFTNVPSHTDYQQHLDSRWNLYYNVDHEATQGDWSNIKSLLVHLFDEQYSMILDYITILYRNPMQKLPVVCLVSKEQGTGKSTFIYLLKLIFKQNMAIISNSDLVGDFNSHWTSKLIVASEETILEKKDAYEKIKALSTAKSIQRNEKNKPSREIPCMLHFVFCSNYENNFIKIDDSDTRLWIRKAKTINNVMEKFDQKIESEIPCFIEFIQNREIEYQSKDRMYFHPKDFGTEAKKEVIEHSEPGYLKEIRTNIKDVFLRAKNEGSELEFIDLGMGQIQAHFWGKNNPSKNDIREGIKFHWGLDFEKDPRTKKNKNTSYEFYFIDTNNNLIHQRVSSGQFIRFQGNQFLTEND